MIVDRWRFLLHKVAIYWWFQASSVVYTQRAIEIILISRGQGAYNATFSGRNLTLLGAPEKGALFLSVVEIHGVSRTGRKSDRRALYDALMKKLFFYVLDDPWYDR